MANPIESFNPAAAAQGHGGSELSAAIQTELIKQKMTDKAGVENGNPLSAENNKNVATEGGHGDTHIVIPPSSSIFDKSNSSPDVALQSKGDAPTATAGDGNANKQKDNQPSSGDIFKKDPSTNEPTIVLKPGQPLTIELEDKGSQEFLTTGPILKIIPGDSNNFGDGQCGDNQFKALGRAVPLSNDGGNWLTNPFAPSYEAKGK